MDTELTRAIDESREVYITTFDSDGRPGTVPVWFDHHAGRFYISTYLDSLKVRKIARNPAVRLAFGRRTGPGWSRPGPTTSRSFGTCEPGRPPTCCGAMRAT